MRTVYSFNVEPRLPGKLVALSEIAYNLWWSWHHDAISLFRRIDRELWEEVNHNPVLLLGRVKQERLEELAQDDGYLSHLNRVQGSLRNYLAQKGWFGEKYPDAKMTIAYFSMEYGLAEALPIYSGGLGVLSGDTLKSASDLGLPLVGVGLAYQQGYFRQYLNIDGWQQESYPVNDFYNLPMKPVLAADGSRLRVPVWFPHATVQVQIWRVDVGRVPLFLLDTNMPENNQTDAKITDALYGGDQEMRIQQEIVLGLGGIRALEAMNISPTVCHMNEGHSAFLTLERIRQLRDKTGLSYAEAREAVGSSNVFTTHTPVPAGFDVFSPALMDKYMRDYPDRLGLSSRAFLGLGRKNPDNQEEGFNMALLAGRHVSYINGVSKLHAVVTRDMWRDQWPEVPANEIPVQSITNGIHTRTWMSHDMAELLDTYIGLDWHSDPEDKSIWKRIEKIPDEELWKTHVRRRERMVNFVRQRLYEQAKRRGAHAAELNEALETLNPNALTIGFARRFATYKRATLILRNPERLRHLLLDDKRPIQIIFAGKAHPKDLHGKELIKQIVHFARSADIRRRVVYLEDYDLVAARYLVQGVDVWLNTPRRPLEASGTSGMKAAANGALNLSVLDGWWDEGYEADVGWAIGQGESYDDLTTQDHVEANALYNLLEREIVPFFYKLSPDGLPRGWIHMMKQSMTKLAPVFNTHRMTQEYAEHFYLPAARRTDKLAANNHQGARDLAAWKAKVRANWKDVAVGEVTFTNGRVFQVGQDITVEATVQIGSLDPADVAVQIYIGALNPEGAIVAGESLVMQHERQLENGLHQYRCHVTCKRSGRQGFGVRVVPHHVDLVTPFDLSVMTWG